MKSYLRSAARRATGTDRVMDDLDAMRRQLHAIEDRLGTIETRLGAPGRRQSQQGLSNDAHLAQSDGSLSVRLEAVATRMDRLEGEIQESRQLNRRIAELTDIVGQVLLPAADRDEDHLRQRLDEYNDHLTR